MRDIVAAPDFTIRYFKNCCGFCLFCLFFKISYYFSKYINQIKKCKKPVSAYLGKMGYSNWTMCPILFSNL